jgi:hypothetical protein
MFKNRRLQLSVVKDDPKTTTESTEPTIDPAIKYAALVSSTVESVGRTVLSGILVIIAAQTAREVIVKRTKEG